MTYDYMQGIGMAKTMETFAIGLVLTVFGVMLIYALLLYVFQSVSLYTIASRRGIRYPGLAWVPVANMWILGSISDQYHYANYRLIRNRRKLLLGLAIGQLVCSIASCFLSIQMQNISGGSIADIYASTTIFLIWELGVAALSIVSFVFVFICQYNLYKSCNPNTATVFLVLSILFGLYPFFFFADRNKDLGMPPRRTVQMPEIPDDFANHAGTTPTEEESAEEESAEGSTDSSIENEE